jgi:hypothetical protein
MRTWRSAAALFDCRFLSHPPAFHDTKCGGVSLWTRVRADSRIVPHAACMVRRPTNYSLRAMFTEWRPLRVVGGLRAYQRPSLHASMKGEPAAVGIVVSALTGVNNRVMEAKCIRAHRRRDCCCCWLEFIFVARRCAAALEKEKKATEIGALHSC